jgi:hypothetical protein
MTYSTENEEHKKINLGLGSIIATAILIGFVMLSVGKYVTQSNVVDQMHTNSISKLKPRAETCIIYSDGTSQGC